MKKLFTGIFLTIIFLTLGYFLTVEYRHCQYRNRAQELIMSVEKYKEANGKLPDSLMDLNLDYGMGRGPYYEKIDETSYKVYFTLGFDSDYVFSSNTKTWGKEP